MTQSSNKTTQTGFHIFSADVVVIRIYDGKRKKKSFEKYYCLPVVIKYTQLFTDTVTKIP
jgi:hypothetical protein